MKIALLISGRVNCNPEQHQNFLTNFVQNHQVDLFVSHNKTDKTHIIEKFIQLYHPIRIVENNEICIDVRQYNVRPEYEIVKNTNKIYNILYMYQSRLNVLNIFEEYVKNTHEKYDIIISSRNDLWFYEKINFEEIKTYTDNHYICIPNPENDHCGLNDHIAFSDNKSIIVYLKLYESFFALLDSGVLLHPESLLNQYLIQKNALLCRTSIPYDIRRYTESKEDTSDYPDVLCV